MTLSEAFQLVMWSLGSCILGLSTGLLHLLENTSGAHANLLHINPICGLLCLSLTMIKCKCVTLLNLFWYYFHLKKKQHNTLAFLYFCRCCQQWSTEIPANLLNDVFSQMFAINVCLLCSMVKKITFTTELPIFQLLPCFCLSLIVKVVSKSDR